MDVFVTYQQDTVQVKNLIQTAPQGSKTNQLNVGRNPVSVIEIPERAQESSQNTQRTYTPEQIRYWQRQRENRLLIDDSRYIRPRTDIELKPARPDTKSGIVFPEREIAAVNTDWLTLVILLGVILFTTVRYFYAKYISHLFLSLFNYSTSARMFQERNYPAYHGAYRLDAIFYITFSVLVFQVLNFVRWENARLNPTYFALVFGMVLAYFFGKKFIYRMLGSLFEATEETGEFLFNMDNFNRSLGLILLPIVALIAFYPAENPVFIVLLGIATIFTFYVVLIQRGIFILLKKQFSIFYLFLYLCTLEFLPLLLIYKVVVE